MKEKLKRFFASIAAIILAIGMMGANAIPAMAADTYTLTINETEAGHTYTAYQIFAGDLATVDNKQVLSNIVAGKDLATDYNSSSRQGGTLAAALKADSTLNANASISNLDDNADAATIAKAIEDAKLQDDSAAAIALAKAFKPFILTESANGTKSVQGTNNYTISGLEAGYYMVIDSATGENANLSRLILEVIANKTINPKSNKPQLEKRISAVKEGQTAVDGAVLDAAGKTAVAKVGSTVSFQLTGAVPSTAGYSEYTYEITDQLSAGLDFVATSADTSNIKVIIGDPTTATALSAKDDYTVTISGKKLTLSIPKTTLDNHQNDENKTITVTYDAKVNKDAVTYNFDKNTAQLEYSNNPEDSSKTAKTPDEVTYVVNINLDVLKVDKNDSNKKLSGAEFKLYRRTGTGDQSTAEYYQYSDNDGVTWGTKDQGKTFTTNANGNLGEEIKGLDKGTYYLEETKAPDGYNLLDKAIEVVVSATKKDNQVTYTVTFRESGSEQQAQNATLANNTITLANEQTVSQQPKGTITVQNGAGSTLPSTGGIGTTIFYVIGGVVVAGAVILLLARRRKNA